jgi:hypothetical protein
MLHVRLIAPSETTPEVLQFLEASPAVTHLCVNEQSARKPPGDVVSFDVAREGATSVLEDLRGFGLEQKGAIVVENLDISISESAIRAEEETSAVSCKTGWPSTTPAANHPGWPGRTVRVSASGHALATRSMSRKLGQRLSL